MLQKFRFFVSIIAVLLICVGMAYATTDCRQYNSHVTGGCERMVLIPEAVFGGTLQTELSFTNTTTGEVSFDSTVLPSKGTNDRSGSEAVFMKVGTENFAASGVSVKIRASDGTYTINMLYPGVWDNNTKVCTPKPDLVVTTSVMVRVSAENADILDAQDDRAIKLTFMALMPDGTTRRWDVGTSATRESAAGPKWGVDFKQTSTDLMVSQTSSDYQFHLVNGPITQSVTVEVVVGNGVLMAPPFHTPVLGPYETWGASLVAIFGTKIFPTDDFSGDIFGEIHFTAEAGGYIVPWPKVVKAGFYPITRNPWVRN